MGMYCDECNIIRLVPTAIRGELSGGEEFCNYFSKKYSDIAKALSFKASSFEEVIIITANLVAILML